MFESYRGPLADREAAAAECEARIAKLVVDFSWVLADMDSEDRRVSVEFLRAVSRNGALELVLPGILAMMEERLSERAET